MIEVNVINERGVWTNWWRNFYEYHTAQGLDMQNGDVITQALTKWHAVEEDQESPVFYFEDERDYVMFMLRWA